MLQATRDIRKVALWLGHADVRTTEVYLRMDPSEKLEAVEAVVPPELRRGRFRAPDALIASLMADFSAVAGAGSGCAGATPRSRATRAGRPGQLCPCARGSAARTWGRCSTRLWAYGRLVLARGRIA